MTTAAAPAAPASAAPPADPTPTPPAPAPVAVDPAQVAADAAAAAAAKPPAPADPAAPPAPPADVQYTLALPKDAVLEASAVERATAFAKAHSLSPEAAQKALEHVNTEVAADRTRQQEANAEAFKKMAFETWVEDLKADKTFGGEKYLSTVEDVERAAQRFLTAEERTTLNKTGWGNHPMLCRMFARIGQAIANDKIVTGGGEGGGEKPGAAQLLYGNTKAT